jgi:hypothetical protein
MHTGGVVFNSMELSPSEENDLYASEDAESVECLGSGQGVKKGARKGVVHRSGRSRIVLVPERRMPLGSGLVLFTREHLVDPSEYMWLDNRRSAYEFVLNMFSACRQLTTSDSC